MYRRYDQLTRDEVWCAGYLSAMGTLTLVNKRYVRLTIRARRNVKAAEQFAQHLNLSTTASYDPTSGEQVSTMMQLSGASLQELLDRLWPALTHERRDEYIEAKRTAEMGKASRLEAKECDCGVYVGKDHVHG